MKEEITQRGVICGAVVWLICIVISVLNADCLNYRNCGAGDMLLMGIISVAMLGPAYLAALLVSAIWKK